MGLIDFFRNGVSALNDFLNGTSTGNARRKRCTPAKVDLTFDETVNTQLTRDLWHNSRDGFKLGAPLCYNPIAVPLAFMGVPHTDLEDWDAVDNKDFWKEKIDFYNKKYIIIKKIIQRMCHRDGTILIWPWFDSKNNYVRWKFILPEHISRALIDPDTEDIILIQTQIRYNFYGENGKLYNYLEEKTYTKSIIRIRRTGSIPPNLNNEDIRRNPIGILPVRFANNIEPNELEGHSDYERIIPLLKAYSKINERAHEIEANIRPKLIQQANNVNAWEKNNSHLFDNYDPESNNNELINISLVDFVINVEGEETKFEVPKGLNDNAISLMEIDFHLIVQSSHVPEICWGLKTKGNHATAGEQMGILLSFVGDKQIQADEPYLDLLNATMKLEAIANTRQAPEGLKNVWNDLTVLTEEERAVIFKDIATGIEKLLASYAIDLQSVHKLLYDLTNGGITSDYDTFEKQVKETGTIKAFLEQEYPTIRETTKQNQDVNNALQNLSEPSDALKKLLEDMNIKTPFSYPVKKEKGSNGR